VTPGQYLRLRREAAGIAIDALAIDETIVAAIENGERAPTDIQLQALTWSFPFSIATLLRLACNLEVRACLGCGCTEWDPCVEADGRACCWVELDFCSSCAGKARPLPEGLAA